VTFREPTAEPLGDPATGREASSSDPDQAFLSDAPASPHRVDRAFEQLAVTPVRTCDTTLGG